MRYRQRVMSSALISGLTRDESASSSTFAKLGGNGGRAGGSTWDSDVAHSLAWGQRWTVVL